MSIETEPTTRQLFIFQRRMARRWKMKKGAVRNPVSIDMSPPYGVFSESLGFGVRHI
jgi:hypothetical protein